MHAREAAFLSLLRWHQRGSFIWDSLEEWKIKDSPPQEELNFAYELGCGTMRMQRLLDYAALQLAKKIPAKAQERMLLRLGLYQRLFLPNIPRYAVCDTTVELAKKYAHSSFASFCNALLRKELPEIAPNDLGTKYSYPDFFVNRLQAEYGKLLAEELLMRGNLPSKTSQVPYGGGFYIQNPTQFELLEKLASHLPKKPTSILDMCAAPGGKTLFLYHRFPGSRLVANESNKNKIGLLTENLHRFGCTVEILNSRGELLDLKERFDLIVVDAPCSNSGVLYKCPEARWRLSKEEIDTLTLTQKALLEKALTLLSPHGQIWYMTCSILSQENEEMAQSFPHLEKSYLQLPDAEGHEGGFGCVIKN